MSGVNHAFSKQVEAIFPDGTKKVFGSINQASKECNITYGLLNDGVNKYDNHEGYYINRKTRIKFKVISDNKTKPRKIKGKRNNCKKIFSLYPDGTERVFISIREASRVTDISYNTLAHSIKDNWYTNTKTGIKFKRI